jgi:hypothetical protein
MSLRESIDKILRKHEPRIMQIPGVTGVGIGEDSKGAAAIKVYVERMTAELRKQLPKTLDGYPVVTEATAEFKAQT